MGSYVHGGAVVRGLEPLVQLVSVLQEVRDCIRHILSLPIMWCLCSADLMCWKSNCRVLVLVRSRLSRIGVVTGGDRHLIRHRLSVFL